MKGRGTDKNERGMEEGVGNLRRDRGTVRGGRKGTRKGGLPFGKELGRIIFRGGQELSRKDEGGTENGFCRGKVGEVMRGGTERKKEPRKVG